MDSATDSQTEKAARKNPKAAKSSAFDYDLIVIGSGPSGQRAAIQAAKIGKRAAVIERARAVGG
ncbi:MAG: FAD-dependent oxidoreductase, partial [Betaproteobacteria bacterium]